MFTKSIFSSVSLFTLALGVGHLAGCGDSGVVHGSSLVSSYGQASNVKGVVSITGNYGAMCLDPAGSGGFLTAPPAWTVAIGTAGSPMVVKNDPSCQLSIAAIAVTDSKGAMQMATPVAPAKSVMLGSTPGAPVLFGYVDSGTGKTENFYANGDIPAPGFASNFVIQLNYSDTYNGLMSLTGQSSFAAVTSTAITATGVAAPDDVLAINGIAYSRDGLGKVDTIAGMATLTQGNIPGQDYAVVAGACPADLASTDAAYQAVATTTPVAMAPTNAQLGLTMGAAIGTGIQSCMIIANCAAGLCSYQLFDITFN
jgi:hypothetical protein